MRINHVAVYVNDLEKTKEFYVRYFGATSNNKYHNLHTGLESYFLSFDKGAKIELMRKPGLSKEENGDSTTGFSHIAFQAGSKKKVDDLTDLLREDGYEVVSEPRMTGDGYYESIILDPEGNRIEITKKDNNIFP